METQIKSSETSDDLPPGSKEWHFAVANELQIKSKKENDFYLKELADFHKAIGVHQPSFKKSKGEQ